jgi:flagellar protein FlaG
MNNDNINMSGATQNARAVSEQVKTMGTNQQSLATSVAVSSLVKAGSATTESLQSNQAASPASGVTNRALEQSVSLINNVVKNVQRDLSFTIDKDSNRTIIKVLDSKSGNVIRQIPTEAALDIAAQIRSYNESAGTESGLPKGILFSDII